MDKKSIQRDVRLEKFVEKDRLKQCVHFKDRFDSCILSHNMGTIFSMCNYELDNYKKCLFDKGK